MSPRTHTCDGETSNVVEWADGTCWLAYDAHRPEVNAELRRAFLRRLETEAARPPYRCGRAGEIVHDPSTGPQTVVVPSPEAIEHARVRQLLAERWAPIYAAWAAARNTESPTGCHLSSSQLAATGG